MRDIFSITLSLFLLIDSFGNVPAFVSILKEIPPKKQRKIIIREMFIALAILITFNFIGESLLEALKISQSTVLISGGIILFVIAMRMIFPHPVIEGHSHVSEDPLIVPLAIPLIAGPAVLASIMIYAHHYTHTQMVSSILIAWGISMGVLLLAPSLQRLLKKRGLIAVERLMGLLLTLLSVQMFLEGVKLFLSN